MIQIYDIKYFQNVYSTKDEKEERQIQNRYCAKATIWHAEPFHYKYSWVKFIHGCLLKPFDRSRELIQ